MTNKDELLNTVVEFYDPHPGFAGAAARLPEGIRLIANELNGTRSTLREARVRLEQTGAGDIGFGAEMVTLSRGPHMWRLLRFRPEIPELDDPILRRIKEHARTRTGKVN